MNKAVISVLLLIASIVSHAQSGKAEHFARQAYILLEQERLAEAELYADSAIAEFARRGMRDSVAALTRVRYEIRKTRRNFEQAMADYLAVVVHDDSIAARKVRDTLQAMLDSMRMQKGVWQRDSLRLIASTESLQQSHRRDSQNTLLLLGGLIALLGILALVAYRRSARLQRDLARAQEDLLGLQAFRDKLYTVLTYDLKSHLSSFENLSQGLTGQVQSLSKEETAQMLSNLHDTAAEMKDTLDNVVHWTALQANARPFAPSQFDCKLLAEEVVRKFQWRLRGRNLGADVYIPENQSVYADRGMVALVLENLLSNAIQYTAPGGKITFFVGRKDGLVTIGLKDSGKGIEREYLEKLFDPRQDFHAIGKAGHKGAGVGLLLARDLVERNGGRIYVESKPGEGSTFYFTLPEKKFE